MSDNIKPEAIELKDEELEAVAGGVILDVASGKRYNLRGKECYSQNCATPYSRLKKGSR